MPNYPLEYRIKDFLNRQITWSQEVLRELDAFCAENENADMAPHLAQQQRRERESTALQKEYHGLAREWEAHGDVAPETRSEIKQLSAEAENLVEKVRASYQRAASVSAARRRDNRNALNDLRRGRRSVTIYSPGSLVHPGFLDKKA